MIFPANDQSGEVSQWRTKGTRMKFFQFIFLVAIAGGAGFHTFGNHLAPPLSLMDPNSLARGFSEFGNENTRITGSIASGVGMGLILFGILGLVIPWVNKIGTAQFAEIGENSLKLFATTSIWLSLALVLTFGVFRLNWSGVSAMAAVLLLIIIISTAATACTAMVFGWKPWGPGKCHQHPISTAPASPPPPPVTSVSSTSSPESA